MPATPPEQQLKAMWHRLSDAEYNPAVPHTVLTNEGRTRGLDAAHLAPALAAVVHAKQEWEYLWAYVGPQPMTFGTYDCELVWYEVEWSDDDAEWVPADEGTETFWHYFGQRPADPPTLSRAEQLAGETDHIDGVRRQITDVDRSEVPSVIAGLVSELAGRPAEPRIWLEPDPVGDQYYLTYDIVVWRGDPLFASDGAEWVSVDEVDDTGDAAPR